MQELNKLKQEYNHNLARYYNGCNYCEEHRNEIDRWLPELLQILNNINSLLEKIKNYQKISDNEILQGFEMVNSIIARGGKSVRN